MPKRTVAKPPAPPAPATPACDALPPPPAPPVKRVAEKIGEGAGNLKAREQAFKRRSGVR